MTVCKQVEKSNLWYEKLSNTKREALFSWMRKLGDDAVMAERHARELEPPYGFIAVGAAGFDYFIKSAAMNSFLSALRRVEPCAALVEAKTYTANCVKLHNAKRSKDVCWPRSEGTVGPLLEDLHRAVCKVIEESNDDA